LFAKSSDGHGSPFGVRRSAFDVRCLFFPLLHSPASTLLPLTLNQHLSRRSFSEGGTLNCFGPAKICFPRRCPFTTIAVVRYAQNKRPIDHGRQPALIMWEGPQRLESTTLRVLEEPPPCTTPAVMPAKFVHRLSRDRLKNVRL